MQVKCVAFIKTLLRCDWFANYQSVIDVNFNSNTDTYKESNQLTKQEGTKAISLHRINENFPSFIRTMSRVFPREGLNGDFGAWVPAFAGMDVRVWILCCPASSVGQVALNDKGSRGYDQTGKDTCSTVRDSFIISWTG